MSASEVRTVNRLARRNFTNERRYWREKAETLLLPSELVFRSVDFYPALDVPEKPCEGIFSRFCREICLASEIESAGIVFKFS
jgi:hypothetical protein